MTLESIDMVFQKVVLNPEYNPEYWEQQYDACLAAIAEAEKDGRRIY